MLIFLSSWAKIGGAEANLFINMFVVILLRLNFIFIISNFLWLYIFFEFSLVPISFIIIGWGYQPERVRAFFRILIYTIAASLPLFGGVILLRNEQNKILFINFFLNFSELGRNNIGMFFLIFIAAFFVKFPLYVVHLWLPKAHVEAPVGGSIILAGILLKLGGYGIIIFSSFIYRRNILIFFQGFSLIGGAYIGILCVRQMDMKVIIAYSSVRHISLVISLLLIKRRLGLLRGVIIMLAHGVASSGIFIIVNLIYLRSGRRRILLNQNYLAFIPFLRLIFFLICMGNIGAPPTFNLWSEILGVSSLVRKEIFFRIFISVICFFAVAFRLLVYRATQQGIRGKKAKPTLLETEMLNRVIHWWLILYLRIWIRLIV